MKDYEDEAFDELEKSLQRKVAHGVTDGSKVTIDRDKLEQVLEALKANQPVNYCMNNNNEKFPMMQEDPFRFERNSKAITTLKEALEDV